MMERTCDLAEYLASRVVESPELELLAPVNLNIVCFRYQFESEDHSDLDQVNSDIVVAIQESGLVAPSTTKIDGKLAIRAAIFNHRTSRIEIDNLIESSIRFGRMFTQRSRSNSCKN
jgi:glutamate/tyrosine decarboxylase-like PLP-dependent enzyme